MMTLIISVFVGLLSALLINYLADILPIKRRIAKPICDACHATVKLGDYLLFFKPCPNCGLRRNRRWLILPVFFPILFLLLAHFDLYRFESGIFDWILISYLSLIVVIDLEYKVILNEVALAGIVICGVAGVLLHGSIITLIGGVSGFLIMLVLYYLGRVFVKVVNKIRGSSITEDDALGFGDVNLSGLLGLLLGWQGIFAGLFFGILVGGLVSGFYLVCQLLRKRYTAYHALPYAPFLIIGALLLLYLPN